MKKQEIVRNNKACIFFPDITIEDQTRGFLVDVQHPALAVLDALWLEFVKLPSHDDICFSIYVVDRIDDELRSDYVFAYYKALPNSSIEVVGQAIPTHAHIIKKKRTSSI